jgi:hypothetical protein
VVAVLVAVKEHAAAAVPEDRVDLVVAAVVVPAASDHSVPKSSNWAIE